MENILIVLKAELTVAVMKTLDVFEGAVAVKPYQLFGSGLNAG